MNPVLDRTIDASTLPAHYAVNTLLDEINRLKDNYDRQHLTPANKVILTTEQEKLLANYAKYFVKNPTQNHESTVFGLKIMTTVSQTVSYK